MKYFPILSLLVLALAACSTTTPKRDISKTPQLQKTSFDQLPNWYGDNLTHAFGAFLTSCEKLIKIPSSRAFRPAGTYGDFKQPCDAAASLQGVNTTALHRFFEDYFYAYQVSEEETDKRRGLFTGYYEASLNGSLRRYGPYQYPLYALPDDLVMADLNGDGTKTTSQSKNGRLSRYPDRAEIDRFGLKNAEVIAWVDDPIDAFFLHIQGSGVVNLDNNRKMRVGYAGKNGHGYFAIGRALIDRGELTKEKVSLQTIRAWLKDHPDQAQDIMNLNPSYVFFRKLDTSGPVGAQNVVLTPQRSLAFDRTLYDYGMPVWLVVQHPTIKNTSIAQLMVAQDTGGAIRGVVRGDFFWGYGAMAEEYAGQMKSQGSYWFLLPKTISIK